MFSPLIPVMVRTKREDMLASIVLSQSVIFSWRAKRTASNPGQCFVLLERPQNPLSPRTRWNKDTTKQYRLKARTVGLCAAYNRLLNYHCVRSTKPVTYLPSEFVRDTAYSSVRSDGHLKKYSYPLEFPDPLFHLSLLGTYYFRNANLLHLRIEQFNRYLLLSDKIDNDVYRGCGIEPEEDDDVEDSSDRFVETDHRHYDAFMEGQPPGKTYASRWKGVDTAKRRGHSRLGVAKTQHLEPIGRTRERFYQQKLVLGLPWYADAAPQLVETTAGAKQVAWVLKWKRPSTLAAYDLPDICLEMSTAGSSFSYEERCHHFENIFSSSTLNIACRCCDGEIGQGACQACIYAVGFHICVESGVREHRWRRNTLFGGLLDVQRTIFNLHRRMFPTDVIRSKAQENLHCASEPAVSEHCVVVSCACCVCTVSYCFRTKKRKPRSILTQA